MDVDHDGPRTEDVYGKPNGWCWYCWDQHRIAALELDLDDIKKVIGFVIGWWPGYEDAIQWDDDISKEDHEFYMAARRLRAAIDDAREE